MTKPISFAQKINWISTKPNDHESAFDEFKKPGKKSFRTNLENGLYAAFASSIFVYPSIHEWILVLYPFDILYEEEQYELMRSQVKILS